MGVVRMGKNNKRNDLGQSVVEYILLMSVVMSLAMMIFKSRYFKNFFGPDSVVFNNFRLSLEHSYRHGFPGKLESKEREQERYNEVHESYFSEGDTHFFFTKEYKTGT